MLQCNKKWYEENKDKVLEYAKEYREANKDIISEKTKIKITCDCGSVVTKYKIQRHCKSKKHQNFINSQNIVV